MAFNVVIKYDDDLPICAPKVAKEAVCNGLFQEACSNLFTKVITECTVKIGYVRMYFKARLIKEFHCELAVSNSTGVTAGIVEAEGE
jgi:hypothetical protein